MSVRQVSAWQNSSCTSDAVESLLKLQKLPVGSCTISLTERLKSSQSSFVQTHYCFSFFSSLFSAFGTGNGQICCCFLRQEHLNYESGSGSQSGSGSDSEQEEEQGNSDYLEGNDLEAGHFQAQFGTQLQQDTREFERDPLFLKPLYPVDSPGNRRAFPGDLSPPQLQRVGNHRHSSMAPTTRQSSKSTKPASKSSTSTSKKSSSSRSKGKSSKKGGKKAASQVQQENIRPASDQNKFQKQHQAKAQQRLTTRVLPTHSPATQETMTKRTAEQMDTLKKELAKAKKCIHELQNESDNLQNVVDNRDETITNLNEQLATTKKKAKVVAAKPLLLEKEDPVIEEIKKVVNTDLWRHCKFIQSEKQKVSVTKWILGKLGLAVTMDKDHQRNWIHTYKDVPNSALNGRCSYAQSEMKKKVFEWIKKQKEKNVPIDDRLPLPETILKCALRTVESDEEKAVFAWYWDDLLASVVGIQDWGPNIRHYTTITEAKVPHTDPYSKASSHPEKLITKSQEAFVVVCYENCYAKWREMHRYLEAHPGSKLTEDPEYKNGKYDGRYTDSRSGQKTFSGWKQEGLDQFNLIQAQILESRTKDEAGRAAILQLEKDCLASLRQKRGLEAADAESEHKLKHRKKKNATAAAIEAEVEVETFVLPGMEDSDDDE